jgi:hypothetical protein
MSFGATGSAVLWGLGREQAFCVPGSGLLSYKAILPLDADLDAKETESKAVNQSGFLEPGVAGPKDGKVAFSLSLAGGTLLEFLEHLCGGVTKDVLEAGVFRYTFEPTRFGVDTSFFGLFAREPVAVHWLYGIKFGKLTWEIGDNTEIPCKMEGAVSHGTRMGAGVPNAGNTGTYTRGPHLRGPLGNAAAGDVYLKVLQVAPSLSFACEQTTGVPAFAGAPIPVAVDANGSAVWQNLQGADGRDLGIWDENRDPLEVIWPGKAADHAALAVGDVFRFKVPASWSLPAVASLTGFGRYTSAHWIIKLRTVGAPVWTEKQCRKGTLTLDWPINDERGSGSRYAFAQLRDGILKPGLKIERALVDAFFLERGEKRTRLEAELSFLGRQLGTGAHRESIVCRLASAKIDDEKRSVKDARTIAEEINLVGETNGAGDAPLVIEVITTRDWTPTAP